MSVIICDLDETIIDSGHRTPNNPDGTLNLAAYKEKHTAKNVFSDKLLPLVRLVKSAAKAGHTVVILTARDMKACDYAFLKIKGIPADVILSRDKASPRHYAQGDGEYKSTWIKKLRLDSLSSVIMLDDSAAVKKAVRRLGIPVLCARKLNKRLHSRGFTV